jgi:hypothetical protein
MPAKLKILKTEKQTQKDKKVKLSFRKRLLEKIYALPDEQREKALRDFELHEYCASKEGQHTILIRDIPHPLIVLEGDRYSRSGKWYMGGMDGRHEPQPRQT